MYDYPEAVSITLKYTQLSDTQLQTAMMEAMLPLVHTGEERIGWMTAEIWEGMYDTLLEQGLLAKPFNIDQAYTLQYLEEIYGSEDR